ncbi:histidine kinase [Curtobacterium sp. MCBD17_035]|uniref:sensor histidine kinase n=1 Tax=Curtobacterium sp. MCBD17_035 TaxID=2175673 RepID=UPI0024DF559D|nr:histidine kinase [Curtobacterium sp. MCBD17_035]WIB67403.1 histidine kinase [Curtobacterium sp. MCBD17_035]
MVPLVRFVVELRRRRDEHRRPGGASGKKRGHEVSFHRCGYGDQHHRSDTRRRRSPEPRNLMQMEYTTGTGLSQTQGMTVPTPGGPATPRPLWLRTQPVLERLPLWVSVTAMIVELVVIVTNGGGLLAGIGALVTLAGALVAARLPQVGLTLTMAGVVVVIVGGREPIGECTVVVFVLFALTLRGLPPTRSIGITALAMAVIFGLASFLSAGRAVGLDAVAVIVAVVAGGAVGAALRLQRQYWESLEQRTRDAIATREAEAERRVAEERVRIARDLHDIVGHQVAVVSMHIGAVEVTAGRDDAATQRSLVAARTAVQSILSDTQRTLAMLRSDDADHDDVHRPTPGLSTIDELAASFQDAGLSIDAQITDQARRVHEAVGVTVFRVAQEALTNAHRYGTGEAALTVLTDEADVVISVTNPVASTPPTAHGSGYGLIGMRERVESAGGTLQLGTDEDVFTVTARIPWNEGASS